MTEKRNSLFEKYRSRVVREGILKAVFCGLIVGLAVFIVSATALWFVGVTWGIWLSLALFLAGTGISVPVFYYVKFKPTAKAIAKRIDKLGLEERILTMMELENDQSFIAMKQREDAVQALKTADHMLIKLVVTTSLIVSLSVVGVFGAGMGTVSALYTAGVIPSGQDLLHRVTAGEPATYTVSYSVGDGQGYILDWTTGDVLDTSVEDASGNFWEMFEDALQNPGLVLEEDENGFQYYAYYQSASMSKSSGVKALSAAGASDEDSAASDGSVSEGSVSEGSASDGSVSEGSDSVTEGSDASSEEEQEPAITNVFSVKEGESCIPVIAEPADGWVFAGWSDGVQDPYRYDLNVSDDITVTALFEPLDGEAGDDADQNGDGEPGENGEEGQPDDSGRPPEEGDSSDSSEGDPNDGTGGERDTASTQINDGETYYGDLYNDAYEDAMDRLTQDDSMPDWMKDIISDYFDAIEN